MGKAGAPAPAARHMATRKSKPADQFGGTNTEARALVDLPAHGVLSGGLLVADERTIADLAAIGAVDLHPDAVAHARTLEF
jgi:hypothetical protein